MPDFGLYKELKDMIGSIAIFDAHEHLMYEAGSLTVPEAADFAGKIFCKNAEEMYLKNHD